MLTFSNFRQSPLIQKVNYKLKVFRVSNRNMIMIQYNEYPRLWRQIHLKEQMIQYNRVHTDRTEYLKGNNTNLFLPFPCSLFSDG
jgi:hypothetical protein